MRSNQLSYRPSGELNAPSRVAIPWKPNRDVAPIDLGLDRFGDEITGRSLPFRKEVIQPQVLLQLPCYDFTPITDHTMGSCPPCGLAH